MYNILNRTCQHYLPKWHILKVWLYLVLRGQLSVRDFVRQVVVKKSTERKAIVPTTAEVRNINILWRKKREISITPQTSSTYLHRIGHLHYTNCLPDCQHCHTPIILIRPFLTISNLCQYSFVSFVLILLCTFIWVFKYRSRAGKKTPNKQKDFVHWLGFSFQHRYVLSNACPCTHTI